MNPLLRTLFAWLLLLALPIQGMAAARMLPCAGGMAAAQTAAPRTHDHAAMLRAMGHGGAGPASSSASASALASASACDHGASHRQGKAGGHGGTCAACCIGVAPVPTPHLPLALGPPDFIAIPFRAGHVTSVDPVLPERPPRFVPA